MGYTSYSTESRCLRAESLGYHTKPMEEIFLQQKERRIHESMSPKDVNKREIRDSEAHPNTLPILLWVDSTGSMGRIPHDLIKDGLPTLMGSIIQNGVPDASLLIGFLGDHECDSYPLQVGQAESGDVETDMWLTRGYIEGGGGGNSGESYLLAWYFAAFHTATDSFEKRGKRGVLITLGDEPSLKYIPASAIKEIMGSTAHGQGFSDKELLAEAQKTYNVYHLHILQGSAGQRSLSYWKQLLGQNCIEIKDYRDVAKTVAKIVQENAGQTTTSVKPVKAEKPNTVTPTEEIL